MKNILKTLNDDKADVEKQFNELEKQRQAGIKQINELQNAVTQTVSQLTVLQGKYQAIDKMIADFQDEPKNKD